MTVRIVTNNHLRDLVPYVALPESAQSDFDYVTGGDRYSDRFVLYRGSWYDTSDTEGHPRFAPSWDQYLSDSFFSGIVFRFPRDEFGTDWDHVIVGTYYA